MPEKIRMTRHPSALARTRSSPNADSRVSPATTGQGPRILKRQMVYLSVVGVKEGRRWSGTASARLEVQSTRADNIPCHKKVSAAVGWRDGNRCCAAAAG